MLSLLRMTSVSDSLTLITRIVYSQGWIQAKQNAPAPPSPECNDSARRYRAPTPPSPPRRLAATSPQCAGPLPSARPDPPG